MTSDVLFESDRPMSKSGFPLDEVVSTVQKAIRRGDEKTALYFALELFPKYSKYLWKRLQVVAVEDIESANAIVVVNAAKNAFMWNNEDKKNSEDYLNRIFFTKTVLYLCREPKSREADHAQHYIDQTIKVGTKYRVPEYAADCHTRRGRAMGKGKATFFKDEQKALDVKGRDDYYKLVKIADE